MYESVTRNIRVPANSSSLEVTLAGNITPRKKKKASPLKNAQEGREATKEVEQELQMRQSGWQPTKKQLEVKFEKNKQWHNQYMKELEQGLGRRRQMYHEQMMADIATSNKIMQEYGQSEIKIDEVDQKHKDECAYEARKMSKDENLGNTKETIEAVVQVHQVSEVEDS